MYSNFTVVFDACVLYPALLRNVLLQLAMTELFRARWTDAIHDEWTRSVMADKPDIDAKKLDDCRQDMNRSVPDCLVTGYEPLMKGLSLPDPDDCHVLAAAIRCRAEVIVTTNLRDFPDAVLEPLGVRAEHPDEFVLHLIDLSPATVCLAIKEVRSRLKKPPHTADKLLDRLAEHGLVGSASKLREFAQML
jgi:predicted nucleic acid-binding protein